LKPLLFVVGSATSYRLQRLFAQYCVANGRPVCFLYDNAPDALFAEVEADAFKLNARSLALDLLLKDGDRPDVDFGRMPVPWRARLFSLLAPAKRSIMVRLLGARMAAAQRVFKELSPSAIVVGEDGISGPAAAIAAARSMAIPVVDLPYGYGTQQDLEIALEEKATNNELLRPEGRLGRLLQMLAPAWIKKGRFSGSLIFPTHYIVAREALGMTLQNAWVVHGGFADRLLVESEQMKCLYRSEGLEAKKLALTGSPYCDTIFATLERDEQARAAFRRAQLVEQGTVRILVSWPTSYHASRAAHSEFSTYQEMSLKVLGWLHSLPGCQLTVSLHPAIQGENRTFFESMGLNISQDFVIELIPKNDIYISYFSSTQRWAIAAGKPVVNYDAYKLGLDVYKDAPAFHNTSTFDDFKAVVSGLMSIDAFNEDAAKQISVAQEWGLVDGQCMPRMLAAIDQLATAG
jgi:hypothetical protein